MSWSETTQRWTGVRDVAKGMGPTVPVLSSMDSTFMPMAAVEAEVWSMVSPEAGAPLSQDGGAIQPPPTILAEAWAPCVRVAATRWVDTIGDMGMPVIPPTGPADPTTVLKPTHFSFDRVAATLFFPSRSPFLRDEFDGFLFSTPCVHYVFFAGLSPPLPTRGVIPLDNHRCLLDSDERV